MIANVAEATLARERAQENAVTAAEDVFGVTIGRETGPRSPHSALGPKPATTSSVPSTYPPETIYPRICGAAGLTAPPGWITGARPTPSDRAAATQLPLRI